MKRMIYPLNTRKVDEIQEINEEECKNCSIPKYLQRDYCSISICVKKELENIMEKD